ncbi:MAG: polysaccharide deacetylase family protein [Desulfobulbaceae bacterium]|nr:polysaccharide deacetylase family protein [Desulfobulbaceae bacterium]
MRVFIAILLSLSLGGAEALAASRAKVPILAYHRFAPIVQDSMTVSMPVFREQMAYLHDHGFTVIPLARLVESIRTGKPLPERAVVITVDDGHRSVTSEMLPVLKKYGYQATLFIYPSAIANASYAMTWEELQGLQKTGLFTIQAHTYWHPNFKIEKRRQPPLEYEKFVDSQLRRSRQKLMDKMGSTIDIVAWPFGIYDQELMARASAAGYIAGLTIDGRHAGAGDQLLALPRYLMNNGYSGARLASLLGGPPTAKRK